MKLGWWIGSFFFTLLLALFTLVVHREQKSGGACYEQNASQNKKISILSGDKEHERPQQADSPATHSESYLCGLITPANLPTDYLVIIGIGGVFVGIFSLRAVSKAADAALLNARAVINAERAWISVTLHMGEVKFYPLRDNNAPIPENLIDVLPIAHLFPAKVVNVGKTPARIEGSAIRYVLTKLHPSKWDATPDYGVLSEYVHYAFPNETLTITAELSPSPTMTQTQIDAVQNGREFLYAVGIVKYRDVYGEPHETQFGYLYKVQDRHLIRKDGVIETIRTGEARFRIEGPRAYNAHT